MGHFLAVSAVRTESVSEVAQAITAFMQSHDVRIELLPGTTSTDSATDASLFSPVGSWVVVLWPEYFNLHDFPLIRSIASARNWLVAGVHVDDSEYWEHLALSETNELHSFCSRPNYWLGAPKELARVALFRPNPGPICAALSVPESAVSRYLTDADGLSRPREKAYASDKFELADFWVFTDFWKALGIHYPEPSTQPELVMRLSRRFSRRLPSA